LRDDDLPTILLTAGRINRLRLLLDVLTIALLIAVLVLR